MKSLYRGNRLNSDVLDEKLRALIDAQTEPLFGPNKGCEIVTPRLVAGMFRKATGCQLHDCAIALSLKRIGWVEPTERNGSRYRLVVIQKGIFSDAKTGQKHLFKKETTVTPFIAPWAVENFKGTCEMSRLDLVASTNDVFRLDLIAICIRGLYAIDSPINWRDLDQKFPCVVSSDQAKPIYLV